MTDYPEDDDTAEDPADTISELQKKLSRLRQKLKVKRVELDKFKALAPGVSPLAPAGGFPMLPVIDGVEFATAEAGVKYSDRPDVMLAKISAGSSIAGVFTRSSTRSASVLDCQEKLTELKDAENCEQAFAILVNSGNSNAFTGSVGAATVEIITSSTAKIVGIPVGNVFTASTGVIGEPLPSERIVQVLDELNQNLHPAGSEQAARAIMTTDTFPKGASSEVEIEDNTVKIAGFAKGSGMIAPDMATMLVFIFTDAKISQPRLQKAVSKLNRGTFNSITVDSDTSTSDTLLVAATGKSDVEIGGPASQSGKEFAEGLRQVMLDLAHQVVRDGEGASKFLEVAVSGATSDAAAKKAALAIANSPLVKTAVAGEDPNWGRVVMAVGKSGAKAERDRLTIRFGDILVAENGWVSPEYKEEDGAFYMKQEDLKISVDLGLASGKATVWTCDLTKQYITINADYRS